MQTSGETCKFGKIVILIKASPLAVSVSRLACKNSLMWQRKVISIALLTTCLKVWLESTACLYVIVTTLITVGVPSAHFTRIDSTFLFQSTTIHLSY